MMHPQLGRYPAARAGDRACERHPPARRRCPARRGRRHGERARADRSAARTARHRARRDRRHRRRRRPGRARRVRAGARGARADRRRCRGATGLGHGQPRRARRRSDASLLGGAAADASPVHQVVDVDGLRIIALDSTVPGYHHGELDAAARLARCRTRRAAPKGTVLALHHAPIPTPVALMDVLELRGQDELAEVVRGRDVRLILGGHLHYADERQLRRHPGRRSPVRPRTRWTLGARRVSSSASTADARSPSCTSSTTASSPRSCRSGRSARSRRSARSSSPRSRRSRPTSDSNGSRASPRA